MQPQSRQENEKMIREQTILSCAKELFYTLGFEQTTMNSISEKSEYTARTIYRYFTNKEDLFYAVLCNDYQNLFDAICEKSSHEDTGYKKISCIFQVYKEFSVNNTKFVVFTIRANEMINNSKQEGMVPYQQKYIDLNKLLFNHLITMYQEAQNDGSIRTDLDAVQLAVSSILTITGYLNMLLATGDDFTKRYNLSESEMIDFTFMRLLEILK